MFSDLEKRLRATYELRVTHGGTLCGLPQGYALGQPFRPVPLSKFIREFLDHKDFGGAGENKSHLWYADIEADLRSYILAGGVPLLNETAGERFTSAPATTTKCLIKEKE